MDEYLVISYHGRMHGTDEECDLLGYERMFAREIPCWVHVWNLMGKWYIGQNQGKYEVSLQWLRTFKRLLWINCNSLQASDMLMSVDDFRYIPWSETKLMHSTCAYDVRLTNKGDMIVGCKVEDWNSNSIIFLPEHSKIKDLYQVRGVITSWVTECLTMRCKQ